MGHGETIAEIAESRLPAKECLSGYVPERRIDDQLSPWAHAMATVTLVMCWWAANPSVR